MSDPLDPILLTDDQRRGIAEATSWESDALFRLGQAYLRRAEAADALCQADSELLNCVKHARHAVQQSANVMRAIAELLQLPQGHWTYDAVSGSLVPVGKDGSHA